MELVKILSIGLLLLFYSSCNCTGKLNTRIFLTGNKWALSSSKGEEVNLSKSPARLRSTWFLGGDDFSEGFSLETTAIKLNPGVIKRKAFQGRGEDEFKPAFSKVKM